MEQQKRKKVRMRRWAAFLLAVCMIVTGVPMPGFASPAQKKQDMLVTEVKALADDVAVQEIPAGTAKEKLILPGSLKAVGYKLSDVSVATSSNTATSSDPADPEAGKPKDITITGVTWEADSDYDPNGVGNTWTFTPVLPGRYILDADAVLPEISVTVRDKKDLPGKNTVIRSFDGDNGFDPLFSYEVEYGTAEADLPLPDKLKALLESGETAVVPVTWVCTGDSFGKSAYVPEHENKAAQYSFEAVLGEGYAYKGAMPYVTVAYKGVLMNPNHKFAEGDGSEQNPWLIQSDADLTSLAESVIGGKTYVGEFFRVDGDGLNAVTAIGNDNHAFYGTFDGNWKTITLSLEGTTYQGLFGAIGQGGTVMNTGVSGSVSGRWYIGGIAGQNAGTVKHCYNEAEISGEKNVGGITGRNNNGTVQCCYNLAAVSGTGSAPAGGVAGYNNGTVENCYNTAAVTGGNGSTGGIAGENSSPGTVQNCYNSGDVTGAGTVGGIAGNNRSQLKNNIALNVHVAGTKAEAVCGRILGEDLGGTLAGNKARSDMKLTLDGKEKIPSSIGAGKEDGESITLGESLEQAEVFPVSAGWDAGIWEISGNMAAGGSLPVLKNTFGNQTSDVPEAPAAYTIKGTVVDESGNKLPAKVILYFETPNPDGDGTIIKVIATTTAGADGGYQFTGVELPESRYHVRAEYAGYRQESPILIDEIENLESEVTLVPCTMKRIHTTAVTITVKKDGKVWNDSGKTFKLSANEGRTYVEDLNAVLDGTYMVYADGHMTGVEIETDGANQSEKEAVVEYYTVDLSKGEGISAVDGGGIYLRESQIRITSTVESGYSFKGWKYNSDGKWASVTTTAYIRIMKKTELTAVAESEPAETYPVVIEELKDDVPWNSGASYLLADISVEEPDYTNLIADRTAVPAGTYYIYHEAGLRNTKATVEVKAGGENKGTVKYYTLTLRKGDGIEFVSGDGIYLYNSKGTIDAVPGAGYEFAGWRNTGDNTLYSSNERTEVVLTKAMDLTAVTEPKSEAKCTVTVKVLGNDHAGMEAFVQLEDGKGRIHGPFWTDEDGYFVFDHVNPGVCTVAVTCDGYDVQVGTVTVGDGDGNAEITLVLNRTTEVSAHRVTVHVYKDGRGWPLPEDSFSLKDARGLEVSGGLRSVPDGIYTLWRDGADTGVKVIVDGADTSCRIDYYTVTFYDDSTPYSEGDWKPQVVLSGRTLENHRNPQKAGFKFLGWRTSAGGSELYDMEAPVTNTANVYAAWSYSEGGGSGGSSGSGGGSSSDDSSGNKDTIHTSPFETEKSQTGESSAASTTTNSATGALIVTTVTKDSNGNVAGAAADVSDTRPSVSLGDTETKIGISVDPAAVNAAVRAARSQGAAGSTVFLNVQLPAEAMIGQLNQPDGKTLQVDVTIPRSVTENSQTPVTGIRLPKEVLETARAAGKDLSVTVRDEQGNVSARWIFTGEDLKNAAAPSGDLNLAVYVIPVKNLPEEKNIMKLAAADNLGTKEQEIPGLAISFGNEGSFPVKARVQIPAGNDAGLKPGDTVYLYYFNPQSGKLESLPENEYTVGADGFTMLSLNHSSDYALLPEKMEGAVQKPEDRKQESGRQVHVVKAGDTIYKLAGAYGCTVNEILEINQIGNVYDLRIGQEVAVPVK